MPVDSIYLKDKLKEADKYLSEVKKVTNTDIDLFLNDIQVQLFSERLFEIISQIILDICTHIVSKQNIEKPSSYADCIDKLVSIGILPNEEKTKFQNLIKMRNIIVHQYTKIDHMLLFSGLKRLDEDFSQFRKFILRWIEEDKSKS